MITFLLFFLLSSVKSSSQLIVVEISTQTLFYFEDGALIKKIPVSTATDGYVTPKGKFQIVEKFPVVFSKRRNNRKLIYWLGFTKNGYYGIHALPNDDYEKNLGKKNSTGCVRVSREDGKWLFKRVKGGTLLIITEKRDR